MSENNSSKLNKTGDLLDDILANPFGDNELAPQAQAQSGTSASRSKAY